MSDNDEEEYEFQYEEEEDDIMEDKEEDEISIENQYYQAKSEKESDPLEALESFQLVYDLEIEKPSIFSFKALKQKIKLLYKLQRNKELIKAVKELFIFYSKYHPSIITKNQFEKALYFILDIKIQNEQIFDLFDLTLQYITQQNNPRLWTTIQLKLAKVCFEQQHYNKLESILKQLQHITDPTQLLEISSLWIQLYTIQKNNKKLSQIYHDTLRIKTAIAHPRILAIIRECGGKMYAREKDWSRAEQDFFEAFKNYDETGNSIKRIACLKYLVLVNMLNNSTINPLDANECKPFQNNKDIQIMNQLLQSYKSADVFTFEKVLKMNKNSIVGDVKDTFMKDHLQELLKSMRVQALLRIIKPYTRVSLPFLAKKLNMEEEEIDMVEALLTELVLDQKMEGKIDQVNQIFLQTNHSSQKNIDLVSKCNSWCEHAKNVHQLILHKVQEQSF